MVFLIREFRHRQPLVDLRVFRHRKFALGCLLIGLLGAGIYGLVTLLPLFYQELMGYTALAAGWAVSPRGIGAIVAMPIIGYLTAKIDNRWLILLGFVTFGVASLWFGEVTLSIGQWTFLSAILISGFGSGCVFVPLSTTTMAFLKNEEIGNASGLYNLLRNIGGGIGTSAVNTIRARHEQLHRSELVASLSPGRLAVQCKEPFMGYKPACRRRERRPPSRCSALTRSSDRPSPARPGSGLGGRFSLHGADLLRLCANRVRPQEVGRGKKCDAKRALAEERVHTTAGRLHEIGSTAHRFLLTSPPKLTTWPSVCDGSFPEPQASFTTACATMSRFSDAAVKARFGNAVDRAPQGESCIMQKTESCL